MRTIATDVACSCVYVVGHTGEPRRNDSTDRDAVWRTDSYFSQRSMHQLGMHIGATWRIRSSERYVRGGDAALCQITFTICYTMQPFVQPIGQSLDSLLYSVNKVFILRTDYQYRSSENRIKLP